MNFPIVLKLFDKIVRCMLNKILYEYTVYIFIFIILKTLILFHFICSSEDNQPLLNEIGQN